MRLPPHYSNFLLVPTIVVIFLLAATWLAYMNHDVANFY